VLADRRESHPLLPTVSLTTLLADFTTSAGSPPTVAPSVPMAAPVAAGSSSSANLAAPDVFKPQPPLPTELAAQEAKSPADTPGSGSGSAGDTPAAGAAPPRIAVQTPSSMALVGSESEGSQPLVISTSQAAAAATALSQPPTADVGAWPRTPRRSNPPRPSDAHCDGGGWPAAGPSRSDDAGTGAGG